MTKDVFVKYKSENKNIFRKIDDLYKSFVKLKFGYFLDKKAELNDFKDSIKNSKIYSIGSKSTIQQISGIYDETQLNKLQDYINQLPKYSFFIWFKFELKAPYFSKDDDEFYIIQNPILKETNFKVPMIRGSSWKGALASAFRELFRENFIGNKDKIKSFLRIFGAGSESIKALESYIFGKNKDIGKVKEKLIEFLLFELGVNITSELISKIQKVKTKEDFFNLLKEYLIKNSINNPKQFPIEFQTHKGRAIFYPTYFDKLSLEIINPHDRTKRAGTNPIHYEVVPPGTEGIFQLIYIPFDGILKPDSYLQREVQEDLNNLCEAIEILADQGIGAKTKLGWGRFEIKDKKVYVNGEL